MKKKTKKKPKEIFIPVKTHPPIKHPYNEVVVGVMCVR